MNTLFGLLVAAAIVVAATTPPIALDIRVKAGSAPFTTRARMTLEPDAANRYLCLAWGQIQGGSEYRSSCQSLEGDAAARTHWQFIKDLPSGQWEVVAYVIRNDEQAKLSNRITLHVLGPNYSIPE